MTSEQGKGECPKCKAIDNLNYGCFVLSAGILYYPYICSQCKFQGQEWYYITFAGHTDENGVEQE